MDRWVALLNKIEREFGPWAYAKALSYRSRESDLVLMSDLALLELVLRNLESNAIKYTERVGLLVTCRARAGQAVLAVWDTSIGIAPDAQGEVFREFMQLARDERHRSNGLGLGLAAVRARQKSSVPALLITADTDPERLREAAASGLPLLHKPVATDQLFQAIVDSRRLPKQAGHLP